MATKSPTQTLADQLLKRSRWRAMCTALQIGYAPPVRDRTRLGRSKPRDDRE